MKESDLEQVREERLFRGTSTIAIIMDWILSIGDDYSYHLIRCLNHYGKKVVS